MENQDLQSYFSFESHEILQIWRIEQFNPKKLASASGSFHKGDSYIVLKKNPESRSYTAHHWVGSSSSQDEYGAAAILVVKLASFLNQKVNVYQEWEANESVLFLSYFPSGVKYLEGGVDSGFNIVKPEQYKPRLLQIKGKTHIRINQVPLAFESLNENDAFILDAGLELFLWVGKTANKQEKSKATFAVISIRDNERNAQAQIRYPRDNQEDEKAFWQVLGGNKGNIKAEDDKKDEDIDKIVVSDNIKFFEVSNSDGQLTQTEITERPLSKNMLKSEETYILAMENDVYVWTGRKSNAEEKETGLKLANEYAQKSGKKKHVRCVRVFEGMEDVVFRMNFKDWPSNAFHPSSTLAETKEKQEVTLQIDFDQMHKRVSEAAYDTFQDITEKATTIYFINEKELKQVKNSDYGHFFDEESYIIDFTYKQRNRYFRTIYYWLGSRTTIEKQTACAFHVAKLTQESKIKASNVRVPMTKEPIEFYIHLFGDSGIMIHKGSFEPIDSYWQNHLDNNLLFQINGNQIFNTVAIEVEPQTKNLNSGDPYLLYTKNAVFVWESDGARNEEISLGRKFSNQYSHGRKIEILKENSESQEFWDALGGKTDYPKHSNVNFASIEPRLFMLSDISGGFKSEEINCFSQVDLVDEDVALLDAYYEIFLWIGSGASENEKKLIVEAAEKYLALANDGRNKDSISICTVFAGRETLNFTKFFKGWDWNLSDLNNFSDPYEAMKEKYKKKEEKVEESKAIDVPVQKVDDSYLDPKKNKFSLAQLQGDVPKGVNPNRKHDYLEDKEFEQVFKVKRDEFEKLKDWKQRDLKKANKLF